MKVKGLHNKWMKSIMYIIKTFAFGVSLENQSGLKQ